ncbi:MAG: peptidoglycan DD-metalloendopeptidase family protein [Acidobacteriota bacterium]
MANGTNGIDQVDGAVSAPSPSSSSARQTPEQLKALAAQFESLLLNQMMAAMRSSMFDDDDKDAGFAKGPLADAMYSELSLALSRAGGFGLSDSMLGPLMREAGTGAGAGAASAVLPSGLSLPLSMTTAGNGGFSLPERGNETSAMALPHLDNPLSRTLSASRISSQFGWRQDPINGEMKFHKGTDIAMPVGQDVPAAMSGRVVYAGERSGYGLTVEVDHGNGLMTRYAHLSEVSVNVGDVVGDGQSLAKSGATGRVTGPHLHFEVLDQGQPVDPSNALQRLAASQSAD